MGKRPKVVLFDTLSTDHPLQDVLVETNYSTLTDQPTLKKQQRELEKADYVVMDETIGSNTHALEKGMLLQFNRLHDLFNGWIEDTSLTNQDIICRLMDWLEDHPRKTVLAYHSEPRSMMTQPVSRLTPNKHYSTVEEIKTVLSATEEEATNE